MIIKLGKFYLLLRVVKSQPGSGQQEKNTWQRVWYHVRGFITFIPCTCLYRLHAHHYNTIRVCLQTQRTFKTSERPSHRMQVDRINKRNYRVHDLAFTCTTDLLGTLRLVSDSHEWAPSEDSTRGEIVPFPVTRLVATVVVTFGSQTSPQSYALRVGRLGTMCPG